MAQTAMQEFIDSLSSGVKIVLEEQLKKALEKEKEQIENAMRVSYKKGWADAFEFIKEIKTKQNENSND